MHSNLLMRHQNTHYCSCFDSTNFHAFVRANRDGSVYCYGQALGPISWMTFPTSFKFDGNFILLSSKFCRSDRYEISLMAQQLCCHGGGGGGGGGYTTTNFPSNFNYHGKIICEMGPWSSLTIAFTITSLITSHDCPSGSAATLKDISK